MFEIRPEGNAAVSLGWTASSAPAQRGGAGALLRPGSERYPHVPRQFRYPRPDGRTSGPAPDVDGRGMPALFPSGSGRRALPEGAGAGRPALSHAAACRPERQPPLAAPGGGGGGARHRRRRAVFRPGSARTALSRSGRGSRAWAATSSPRSPAWPTRWTAAAGTTTPPSSPSRPSSPPGCTLSIWKTTSTAELDFREPDYHEIARLDAGSGLVFGAAESYEELLEKLSGLLGRQKALPDWAMKGLWLGVQGGTERATGAGKALQGRRHGRLRGLDPGLGGQARHLLRQAPAVGLALEPGALPGAGQGHRRGRHRLDGLHQPLSGGGRRAVCRGPGEGLLCPQSRRQRLSLRFRRI